jgi:hypothetical protein
MTDENGASTQSSTPKPKISEEEKAKRRSVSIAIILVMIILGTVLIGFALFQFLIASQTEVYVLDVEVEVKEIEGVVHIIRVESSRRLMDILDSPRSDDQSIHPGVRVKLIRGQEVLSYDEFVKYKGDGVYNLVVGLKHMPIENEILKSAAWVHTGNQGLYPDDQESVTMVWSDVREVNVLKVRASLEGKLETGSNARITDMEVSQESGTMEIGNSPIYYPGVYGYVQRNDEYTSFIASELYDSPGNYTLYIGLLFEPKPGDTMTVIIQVWQRNGDWLEGEYEVVTSSQSQAYTWS